MKIAFPTNNGVTVEQHFGHCERFAVYTVENKEILNKEMIEAPEHVPGAFPKFLGGLNVNVIITGGMGQRAIDLFKEQNVDVILGASGSIEENLEVFLDGDLYSNGTPCQHEHGDHDHDYHHN